MKQKNIHHNHRQRMRDKFDKIGFEGWSQYEILEYMLYNVYRQGDTNPIAHNMLNYSAGNIVNLMDSTSDFRLAENVNNVGEKTVLFLRSLKAFVDYYKREEIKYRPIEFSMEKFFEIINVVGFKPDKESILMICADAKFNVKNVVDVTEASGTEYANTSPEILIRTAMTNGAKCVILAHNHPDGSLGVSHNDIVITNKLDELFMNMGIVFMDHFIVGNGRARSIKKYILRSELKHGLSLYDDTIIKE